MEKSFKCLGMLEGETVLEITRQSLEHTFIMLLIPAQCVSTHFEKSNLLDKDHFVWNISHSQWRWRPTLASGLQRDVTPH